MADPFAAVVTAADAGRPLRPKDLLAFEPAAVRRLFERGLIVNAQMRHGTTTEAVILPMHRPVAAPDRTAAPVSPLPADPPLDDDAWTGDELAYLRLAYPAGVSFAEMAKALGRSGGEIIQEAWRHDLARPARRHDEWGREIPAWRVRRFRRMLDEATHRGANLNDDGDGLDHGALARRFAVGRAIARDAGRHRQPWTEAEDAELRVLNEQGKSIDEIAGATGRHRDGVIGRLGRLGLSRDRSWRDGEDRLLVAALEIGMTAAEASAMLPGRTILACKLRGQVLVPGRGFDRWEPEEDEALRIAYARGENIKAFGIAIGRTPCGARHRARVLGLHGSHENRVEPYSEAEDRRIREGWARCDAPREIAADLGRSITGVYNRAFKLGLTGHGRGRYHGPRVRRFEVEYVRVRVEQGWTAKQIAERLRRSHHMVYQIARKNGIRFPQRGPRRQAAE